MHLILYLCCLVYGVISLDQCLLLLCQSEHLICRGNGELIKQVDIPCRNSDCLLKSLRIQGYKNRTLPHVTSSSLAGILTSSLTLKNLGITEIEQDAFCEMSSVLEELDLSDNNLESLPTHVFSCLENLRVLNLGMNSFTQLPSAALKSVHKLTSLNLIGNRLFTMKEDDFSYMHHLKALNLAYNCITAIPQAVFQHMPNLQALDISGNSLVCDCQLAWLRYFIQDCLCECSFDNCSDPFSFTDYTLENFPISNCPLVTPICQQTRCVINASAEQDNGTNKPEIMYFFDVSLEPHRKASHLNGDTGCVNIVVNITNADSASTLETMTEQTEPLLHHSNSSGIILTLSIMGCVSLFLGLVFAACQCRLVAKRRQRLSLHHILISDGGMEHSSYNSNICDSHNSRNDISDI